MDGLTRLYAEHGPVQPRLDHNNSNDFHRHRGQQCCIAQVTMVSGAQLARWVDEQGEPDRALLVRLVQVELFVRKTPYQLDISNKNQFLARQFQTQRSAYLWPLIVLVVASYDCQTAKLSLALSTLYITSALSFRMMHRQAFHRASGGDGITIKDIFQDGLAYLASLAFHPFYPLLAAAIAFNLAIDGRLAEVQQKVSEVEHKTGYHTWSMHHYAKADGDYSSLSTRMSVVATTLAANKRLNVMAAEILPTFDAHSDL